MADQAVRAVSASPAQIYRRLPRRGEHTTDVLREAGLTDPIIEEARQDRSSPNY